MRFFELCLFGAGIVANSAKAYGSYEDKGGYGTTGHYGNQYGHGGYDDHAHEDHIYGYDSVEQDLDLDAAAQGILRDAIITRVEEAHQDRIDYLTKIRNKRV